MIRIKWMLGLTIILISLLISCTDDNVDTPTTITVWTDYNGIAKKLWDNFYIPFANRYNVK